jgi:hypothetical protein
MKSIFWNYFKNTLGWLLLQAPDAVSAIAKGVALVFDDVREDIFWLRDQLNPATCEGQYVAPHGEARGMDRHPLESDEQYRNRVVHARAWHGQGGKAQGMPRILEHYGYKDCSLYNCRKDDEARWAEFVLSVKAKKITPNDYGLLGWAVGEAKPARSKLAALRIDVEGKAGGTVTATGVAHVKTALTGTLSNVFEIDAAHVPVGGYGKLHAPLRGTLPIFEDFTAEFTTSSHGIVKMHVVCSGLLDNSVTIENKTVAVGGICKILVPIHATIDTSEV